ncbi:MAG: DUF2948 family protein [Rhodoblastus sp.]|nr:DUF2948 family protein [Rhodoblastus sp.]
MTQQCPDSDHPLRLIAFDPEDLEVVSAHLQDALARVGDMAWLPEQDRFVLGLSRFDWISADAGQCERAVAALRFERVRTVRQNGVPQREPNSVLSLLAISFEPTDAPAGRVLLTFSGGAAVRLDVECLEVHLRDLGPRWTAKSRPGHALDAGPAQGS